MHYIKLKSHVHLNVDENCMVALKMYKLYNCTHFSSD